MKGLGFFAYLALSQVWLTAASGVPTCGIPNYDLVIVGGTGAGVAAAIQASRLNLSVALLEESGHLGGIAVEGAGGADLDSQPNFQNSLTIGPMVLELYRRMAQVYGRLEGFDQARKDRVKSRDLWRYECHKGERMFLDWLAEENVDIFTNMALKGTGNGEGVVKDGTAITSVLTECGKRFEAKYFIDATYEGDLLASAGVNYVLGRESRDTYGEPYAGVLYNSTYSNLQVPVDPYLEPGNPASGLIPTVQDYSLGPEGSGDGGIQAYSWRLCLTNRTDNQVTFEKPADYDPSQYVIYSRYSEAGGQIFTPPIVVPNDKTDLIGSTPLGLGFDMPGRTDAYPEASRSERLELSKELENWQRGLLYFLANDPSMPESVRAEWSTWGYAKDEFVDNNNFPRRMYARGLRRMQRDDLVITTNWHEYDLPPVEVNDPILVNLWPQDVHSVRRIVKDGAIYDEGFAWNEGPPWRPFNVPYKAIVPHREQVSNLITPVAPSGSYLGFGLVRTEHTFTTMGQVSAFAVAVAIQEKSPSAEDIPYALLREHLVEAGFVLDVTSNGIPQNVSSVDR